MAKTRVELITKRLLDYAHTLESSYYSACVTYNAEKKSLYVSLRTKMAYSFLAGNGNRPIGTHYTDITVQFKSKNVIIADECKKYDVSYSGSDYNEKIVNPNTVFDPGVSPSEVVLKAIVAAKFKKDDIVTAEVRHVSY